MRIPSGSTDRYIYFVAVDSTDLKTREQSLTTFTVYGSRNGGAAAVFTTPTVNETDTTNMPGVYELLLDEQTTLTAGNDTEELCLHITQASMAPVTRTVEIYRPETTEGNTLDVTATGAAGMDWGNVENQGTSVSLTSTTVSTVTTTTTATNLTTNNDKTGYTLSAAGVDAIIDETLTSHVTADSLGVAVKDILADTADIQPNYATSAAQTTAQNDLDIITGASGVVIAAADIVAGALDGKGDWNTVVPDAAGTAPTVAEIWDETMTSHVTADSAAVHLKDIVADTNELQTDDYPTTIATIQSDTDDIQTRLPAALIGGRMDSTVSAINNNTTSATQLALSAEQIESGQCEGTPSTTVIQTDLAETQDDIYIGRTVIFTSGNARGEATDITDYAGATGTITVTALANAPAATDTFILI